MNEVPSAPLVEAGPCEPDGSPGSSGPWWVTWRLRAAEALVVEELWLPHDHFFSDRFSPHPPVRLEPRVWTPLTRPVRCTDPPGSVIENAFLILRCSSARVFARLTITVDSAGTPRQVCESVTVQAL